MQDAERSCYLQVVPPAWRSELREKKRTSLGAVRGTSREGHDLSARVLPIMSAAEHTHFLLVCLYGCSVADPPPPPRAEND